MTVKTSFLDTLLTKLSYKNSPGLYCKDNTIPNTYNGIIFSQLSNLHNLDAVYFIKDKPIICFVEFPTFDQQQINQLHLNLWNDSSISILVVVVNDQILCYSNYIPPTIKDNDISNKNALLFSTNKNETIALISRQNIDSGFLWNEFPNYFLQSQRVTYKLIENLKTVCTSIAKDSSKKQLAQNLVMKTLLFTLFYEKGLITQQNFLDAGTNKDELSSAFSSLRQTNNTFKLISSVLGNKILSQLKSSSATVENKDLISIKSIFLNRYSPDQNCYGIYNYKYIKADTICSVLEELLYLFQKGVDIASHTPGPLVKLMLDQILPNDNSTYNANISVLDPACGSGIFLQETYRRLICKWILSHKHQPTQKDLLNILNNNIFGIDLKSEAIVSTTISLFLTFIEFLDNNTDDNAFKFPLLYNTNILHDDFFNKKIPLKKTNFDFIIGNPPWQSNYPNNVKEFLSEYKHVVGDKQISQVFLWKSAQFISKKGKICLLMPSKGLMYNFNPKNIVFRETFFSSHNIEKIINLSLFSNLLFDNSKFPASIVLYSLPDNSDKSPSTVYYTPRPPNKCWEFSTIIEDSVDIKKIPTLQTIKNKYIWKTAYVGSSKDLLLIAYLDKNFTKVADVCQNRKWINGEGFQLGGGDKNVNKKMAKLPYIPAKSIFPFHVPQSDLKPLEESVFHRQRDFELYQAPHTIVRGGQIFAAYIPYDAVFTHAVVCFASQNPKDADLLKLLAAYLNSSTALYYLFLTSSTWCIERTDIHFAEYKILPFAIPNDKLLLNSITSIYDQLSEIVASNINNYNSLDQYHKLKNDLDNKFFELFGLNNDQKQLIIDTCKLTIPYYEEYSKSTRSHYLGIATESPDSDYILNYAKTFTTIFNAQLSQYNHHLKANVYHSSKQLNLIEFTINRGALKDEAVSIVINPNKYALILENLDKQVTQTGTSIYQAKYLRIYDGSTFYITKPPEKRYWCPSCAYADAERNLKETLKLFAV